MFSSSPITTWEGAGAFFTWAGTNGAVVSFWVMVVLCIIPIVIALKAENAAEEKYGK